MPIKQTAGILAAAGCLAAMVSACGDAPARTEESASTGIVVSSATAPDAAPSAAMTSGPTKTPTATPRPSPGPEDWKTYPVVPAFAGRVEEIFQNGIALGRDPHAFSKIGDCQNIVTYFLADFEKTDKYRLGPYAELQETIDWFKDSFGRKSLAVKGGMNVASVMNPLMADPDFCRPGESPLACEIRLHNPGVVLISFEEAWDGNVEKYETYMRKVIEYSVAQGVVPIVATKADNLEGGHEINALIARLAWEYDIPLWNFWAAVQPLPSRGLSADGFHLTQGYDFHNYYFDLPISKWSGWMARNLTALQVLDAARGELISPVAA